MADTGGTEVESSTSRRVLSIPIMAFLGIFAAAIWALYRSGVDTVFYLHTDALRAANWPNPGLRSEEAYTRTSAIGPWLYKLLGGNSDLTYLILCSCAVIVGVGLIATWCWKLSPGNQKSRAARLVLLGPVVAILVTQLGNYDPFTVIGLGFVLWSWSSGNRILLSLSGIYLGVQHFEQGLIAVLILSVFVHFAQDWMPPRLRGLCSPLWAIIGLFAGKILLSVLLITNHVSGTDGRLAWISDPELLRMSVIGSVNFLPVLLLSLFAGSWAIVIAAGLTDMRPRLLAVLGGLLVFACFFSAITLDHTRIFVMISLPLLAVLTVGLMHACSGANSRRLLILVEAMTWVVVPMSVLTSPDGPTFLKEMNVADHAIMLSHRVLNML